MTNLFMTIKKFIFYNKYSPKLNVKINGQLSYHCISLLKFRNQLFLINETKSKVDKNSCDLVVNKHDLYISQEPQGHSHRRLYHFVHVK